MALAAASGRHRLGRRKSPPPALVEQRSERLEPQADGRFIDYTN